MVIEREKQVLKLKKEQKIHRTMSSITNTQNDCPINLIEKLDYDLILQFN